MYHISNFDLTEEDIKMMTYVSLKEVFPFVRSEISVKSSTPRSLGGRGARVDFAVFDASGNLTFTVEVKRNPNRISHAKQAHYEEIFGVPNILIAGEKQALKADEVCRIALSNR